MKKNKRQLWHFLCLIIFLLNGVSPCLSQEQTSKNKGRNHKNDDDPNNYNCFQDLAQHWVVFNTVTKKFSPYLGIDSEYEDYIQINLMRNMFKENTFLKYKVPKGSSLFINGQLIKIIDSNSPQTHELVSWKKKMINNQLLVTIYKKGLQFNKANTCLAFFTKPVEDPSLFGKKKKYLARSENVFREFILVASIIISLAFIIFNLGYLSMLKYYFDYRDLFSRLIKKENPILLRINDIPHQILNLINSSMIALIILTLANTSFFMTYFPTITMDMELSEMIKNWVILTGVIYCLILLKYTLLKVMSSLMQLRDMYKIHFFEFTRMSILMYLFSFIAIFIIVLYRYSTNSIDFDLLVKIISVVAFIRIILLYFKLVSMRNAKNIFIISYLCITDFIPYFIGLKFLVY